jgi:hypothetical protein
MNTTTDTTTCQLSLAQRHQTIRAHYTTSFNTH